MRRIYEQTFHYFDVGIITVVRMVIKISVRYAVLMFKFQPRHKEGTK